MSRLQAFLLAAAIGASAAAQPRATDGVGIGANAGGPPGIEEVSQERLIAIIGELPTARAALGDKASREGLEKTERWLLEKLRGLGYEPGVHEFGWSSPMLELIHKKDRGEDKKDAASPQGQPEAKPSEPQPPKELPKYRNYWVDVKGTEFPTQVLMISCHYDAVPKAPGADDDGTGVACVLEMARILKDHPGKRTIRLMFFTLEECGLVGSMQYVKDFRDSWKKGDERLVGMVSLDMLGFFRDEPGSQTLPSWTPGFLKEQADKGDWIGMAGVLTHQPFSQRFATEMRAASPGLKVLVGDFFPIAPPDLRRSDHWPFVAAGWPGIILADTAEMRNPNYHTPRDTIQTIDAARYTQVVRGVLGATRVMADLPGDDPALCTGKAKPAVEQKKPAEEKK